MNTTTAPAATTVSDMPVVDSPLDAEVADQLGNDVILGVAAGEKTQKVRRAGRATWSSQSGESRAWTSAGNVD